MNRKNGWTKKEDAILVALIFQAVNYGTSVSKACEVASVKLNRTYDACKSRWQKQLRKKYRFSRFGSNEVINSKIFADWIVDTVSKIS